MGTLATRSQVQAPAARGVRGEEEQVDVRGGRVWNQACGTLWGKGQHCTLAERPPALFAILFRSSITTRVLLLNFFYLAFVWADAYLGSSPLWVVMPL